MLGSKYLLLALFFITACATTPLPNQVNGRMPSTQPLIIQFYDGKPLGREHTSLLVAAHYEDQTQLYITGVNQFKKSGQGLIGGAEAANVMPGTHDISLQYSDRGRVTMPIKLTDVPVKANVGYLINFSANYPNNYMNNPIASNSALKIRISVTDMDTQELVRDVTFNGWGKIVTSTK